MRLEESIVRQASSAMPEERRAAERAAPGLAIFLSIVLERNATMNLVSARSSEPDVLVERHLFDSLFGLRYLPQRGPRPLRLLDLGSGGGFPAIPLLLVRGDLEGTLVESAAKKADFLTEVVKRLALKARVVTARFPDSFPMEIGPFDVLTTRAVAKAGKLVRRARPLLGPGARALLWTTAPLVPEAVRDSRAGRQTFHKAPWAERSGILALECFT